MGPHGHATAVAMVSILVMISLSGATAKSCQQYQEATLSVVNKVIWPSSREIAVSGVPPPEFATNVNGRVVPLGVFTTSLGALEYFFRLGGPLDLQDTFSSRVSEANVRWMVCDNHKRQTLFRVISPSNPALNYNISAMGVFSFNKDGKICAYDWDLRRLGFTVETTYVKNIINSVFGGNTAVYQEQVRLGICSIAMTLCNGTNTQYASMAECMDILSKKPVGDWDRVDQDNVACRQLHSFLVPIRPNVHCPHIGPDGGGKCVEHPINSLFTDDFAACTAE